MSDFIIRFRKTWIFILKITMLISLFSTFYTIWSSFYSETLFYNRGNYLVMFIYTCIFFILYHIYSVGKIDGKSTSNILSSWFFVIVSSNVFIYFIISLISGNLLRIDKFIILIISQFLISIIYSLMSLKLYYMLYPIKDVMLIYGEYISEETILKIIKKDKKYNLINIKSQKDDITSIIDIIDKVDGVFLYSIKGDVADKIINYCYCKNKRLYIIPTLTDIIIKNSFMTQVSDIPIMLCKNRGLMPEQLIIKRIFDIIVSIIGLVVLSPIMLITSIVIKLYDKGPVFFKQKRVTKDERVFILYKFRSMIINAEKDGKAILASKNDSRITPIGNFIRSTRIDEIPQLLNILKGDMTLVGPRPERPEIISEYIKVYPDFAMRTKVKSGLTGYAQVYGKYNTKPEDKIKLDLIYIEKYSFWLDIKIIFLTFQTIFISESTEGVDKK
ncbi:MAG: exopolysaccharide biosynthesis polyprenyl glycosylphosphotransferase [Oscillospiraceae bacterium]|nr:exopolysaccharide biosynthesis polyprenyl glycosylphosphotransferase [Oscillospiraceae bacterium]